MSHSQRKQFLKLFLLWYILVNIVILLLLYSLTHFKYFLYGIFWSLLLALPVGATLLIIWELLKE
ncbi:MAG TPA: hypothetical protein ENG66_00720 [Thermococcus sp.]|nr:hypothetical protein [Thermococcus sp.]